LKYIPLRSATNHMSGQDAGAIPMTRDVIMCCLIWAIAYLSWRWQADTEQLWLGGEPWETGKEEIKHRPGATSCHIASDGRMNWKRFWKKRPLYYPEICLEGLREITKIITQDSLSLGWDSKRIPLEYKSRGDTSRAACSAAASFIMNLTQSHTEWYPRLRDVTSATKLQRGLLFISTHVRVYVTVYNSLSVRQKSNAVCRYY
jgi:hypothetical protein